jgi:hypothetical protein
MTTRYLKGIGVVPSMGVTCGSVREPGSLTLPILVGFVDFF